MYKIGFNYPFFVIWFWKGLYCWLTAVFNMERAYSSNHRAHSFSVLANPFRQNTGLVNQTVEFSPALLVTSWGINLQQYSRQKMLSLMFFGLDRESNKSTYVYSLRLQLVKDYLRKKFITSSPRIIKESFIPTDSGLFNFATFVVR